MIDFANHEDYDTDLPLFESTSRDGRKNIYLKFFLGVFFCTTLVLIGAVLILNYYYHSGNYCPPHKNTETSSVVSLPHFKESLTIPTWTSSSSGICKIHDPQGVSGGFTVHPIGDGHIKLEGLIWGLASHQSYNIYALTYSLDSDPSGILNPYNSEKCMEAGNLGQVISDAKGKATISRVLGSNGIVTMESLLGHPITLYSQLDDCTTGLVGSPLASCYVGLTNPSSVPISFLTEYENALIAEELANLKKATVVEPVFSIISTATECPTCPVQTECPTCPVQTECPICPSIQCPTSTTPLPTESPTCPTCPICPSAIPCPVCPPYLTSSSASLNSVDQVKNLGGGGGGDNPTHSPLEVETTPSSAPSFIVLPTATSSLPDTTQSTLLTPTITASPQPPLIPPVQSSANTLTQPLIALPDQKQSSVVSIPSQSSIALPILPILPILPPNDAPIPTTTSASILAPTSTPTTTSSSEIPTVSPPPPPPTTTLSATILPSSSGVSSDSSSLPTPSPTSPSIGLIDKTVNTPGSGLPPAAPPNTVELDASKTTTSTTSTSVPTSVVENSKLITTAEDELDKSAKDWLRAHLLPVSSSSTSSTESSISTTTAAPTSTTKAANATEVKDKTTNPFLPELPDVLVNQVSMRQNKLSFQDDKAKDPALLNFARASVDPPAPPLASPPDLNKESINVLNSLSTSEQTTAPSPTVSPSDLFFISTSISSTGDEAKIRIENNKEYYFKQFQEKLNNHKKKKYHSLAQEGSTTHRSRASPDYRPIGILFLLIVWVIIMVHLWTKSDDHERRNVDWFE